MPCEVFESLKVHFIPEPLRPGHWRTEGTGWHIHAVEEGVVVNIHVDSNNPTQGVWRMMRHFVQDVVVTCLVSTQRYGQLCLRPYYVKGLGYQLVQV